MKSRWSMRWRNVKQSGSKRLSLCPSALFRKLRYSNTDGLGNGTISDGELSPDNETSRHHVHNHNHHAIQAVHHPLTGASAPSHSSSSHHRVQPKLCEKCTAASINPLNHNNSHHLHQVHLIQPASSSVTTFLEQHQINGSLVVNGTNGCTNAGDAISPSLSPCAMNGNGSVRILNNSLIESRKVTSYQQLKLSFFTEDSPTHSQPPTITIRMKPDSQGRFGFNVKGGKDQNLPVLVSRVAPNSSAENAIPKLTEGDQVLQVNGTDVDGLPHEEVVSLIRSTKETAPAGELVLLIRPNVYTQPLEPVDVNGEDEEPTFEYIPVDASPASKQRVRTGDRLYESIMLLTEQLETGAVALQFDSLYKKKAGESMNISKLLENSSKNRYRDIMPYDSTRVSLKDGMDGDYINASFVNMEIPSSGIINRYIATQGPLSNTCDDFWLMVWEQKSSLIVSATPLVERGRIKCFKYWPDLGQSMAVGQDLSIYCSRELDSDAMVERDFQLTCTATNETRLISHIQYLAWPDHGVPEDHDDFLEMVNKVRNIRMGSVDPVIVHCSAGIGRTGVLIMMETAMCLIEANEPIYPIDILKSMRDQRAMLIQTSGQFVFVCSAIQKVYNEQIVCPLKEFHNQKLVVSVPNSGSSSCNNKSCSSNGGGQQPTNTSSASASSSSVTQIIPSGSPSTNLHQHPVQSSQPSPSLSANQPQNSQIQEQQQFLSSTSSQLIKTST